MPGMSLFDPARAEEVKRRMSALKPESQRLWGKMTPSQMLAHCAAAMEMATGDSRPQRMLIGRLLGPFVKRAALKEDEPLRKNTPTMKSLVMKDERDFNAERARLNAVVDRFAAGGPKSCTTHPHSFFGPLAPEEWATLMYKHLDHHLRQFGV